MSGSAAGKTLVIKLGTSVLTQGAKQLNRAHMVETVRACAAARAAGHRIIIVSSGAIAAGREHLGYPDLPACVACKQMLAAVGQSRLIRIWEELFALYDLRIGQMLLTRADLEDRERFLNARDTLHALLDYGIIPVINENDAVATAEIKVGDNDNLSALVAMPAEADLLLLLTDQEGLFTADPRTNPEATLIPVVERIDDSIRLLAGGSISGLGTGGMATKIQAAETAVRAGVKVIIAAGARPSVITDILEGKSVGTAFLPARSPLESRKLWIFGPAPAGTLHVDAGAAKALRTGKGSLLPKGVVRVEGDFGRGAVVRITGPDEHKIAQGVARYSSDDMQRIAGRHSSEIPAVLGYEHGPTAVHRDDLVMMGGSDDNAEPA